MTKSGSLISSANGEADRQKAKYHEDHDITVKPWLWFYAITELVCDPNCLFYKSGKEGSNRFCQMSKLTYSQEGLLWLFITWQYERAHTFPSSYAALANCAICSFQNEGRGVETKEEC